MYIFLGNLSRPDLERELGRCIFIYSGSPRLISFEIRFFLKETGRAKPEFMNVHPINALDPALKSSKEIFQGYRLICMAFATFTHAGNYSLVVK